MTKELIKQKADEIKKELFEEGCVYTLFGEPFDTNDPDAVLVALYYKMEQEKYSRASFTLTNNLVQA